MKALATRDCQQFRVWRAIAKSRRHGSDEAFAEDDSEPSFGHRPFTWHFPLFLRPVQYQTEQFGGGAGEVAEAKKESQGMQNHGTEGPQEAIHNLIATYNICGDGDDLAGLSRTFASEGALALSSGQVLLGRAEIIAFLKARRAARTASAGAARASPSFNVADYSHQRDDRAGAKQFYGDHYGGPYHSGTYRDNFILTENGWLIARRQVAIDWISEHSHWFPGEPKRPA